MTPECEGRANARPSHHLYRWSPGTFGINDAKIESESESFLGTEPIMKTATTASWKLLPAPRQREDLRFEAFFTDAESERLTKGLVPSAMEDKWFIYFADGWMRFHRSWTGVFIYGLRLDGSPAGVRVVESWVNRDPEQSRTKTCIVTRPRTSPRPMPSSSAG